MKENTKKNNVEEEKRYEDFEKYYRNMQWLKPMVAMEMDRLTDYLNEAESWISREAAGIAKRVQDEISVVPSPAQRDDILEQYEDEIQRFSAAIPTTLRESMVIFIYAAIENRLMSMCRLTHFMKQKTPKPKWGRDIITNAKGYLQKHRKVAFPKASNHWQQIKLLQRVRNIMVHNGGVAVQKDIDYLGALLNPSGPITLDSLKRLVVKKEYCGQTLESCREFFFEDLFPNLPGEF